MPIKGRGIQSLTTSGQEQVVDITNFPSVAARAVQEIKRGSVQAPPMTVDVLLDQEHQQDDPRALLGLLHGTGIIHRGIMATRCVYNYVCTAQHGPNGLTRSWQRFEDTIWGMKADDLLECSSCLPWRGRSPIQIKEPFWLLVYNGVHVQSRYASTPDRQRRCRCGIQDDSPHGRPSLPDSSPVSGESPGGCGGHTRAGHGDDAYWLKTGDAIRGLGQGTHDSVLGHSAGQESPENHELFFCTC